jgi:hypothetical protein
MKYELWEVCSFGNFEIQAMILNKSFDNSLVYGIYNSKL